MSITDETGRRVGRPPGPTQWRVYTWTGTLLNTHDGVHPTRAPAQFIAFTTSPAACARLAGAASSALLRGLAESISSLEIQSAQQYPNRVLCRPADSTAQFTVLPPSPRYY